jgi:hypothetical protein
LTGHHRRAACAAWLSGLLAVSVFILSRAAWLWSWNRGAGAEALEGTTLEHIFIGMGMACIVGAIAWIVQALDGGRLAEHRFQQSGRHTSGGAAFALLAALAMFALLFQPASVAETLDDLALSAEYEGFLLLPLHAELAAMRLDPSRPVFAVRAAELYEELGREENAWIIRSELVARWKPCIGALRRHGLLGYSVSSETVDGVEEESPGFVETIVEEPEAMEAPTGLWERIRSEYGLFALPVE